ncbi:hypothetical protein GCM10027073_61980 [Streptomyces chlorus]
MLHVGVVRGAGLSGVDIAGGRGAGEKAADATAARGVAGRRRAVTAGNREGFGAGFGVDPAPRGVPPWPDPAG